MKQLFNLNNIVIFGAVIHIAVLFSFQKFIFQFFNLSNFIFNFEKIVVFVSKYSSYIFYIILGIYLMKYFLFKEDKNKNLMFYLGLPLYLIIYLFISYSQYLLEVINNQFYFLKIGELLFLIFLLIIIFFLDRIFKLSFLVRTDEEILNTGMHRVPNTIKIIKFGFSVFIFILITLNIITLFYLNFILNEYALLILFLFFTGYIFFLFFDIKNYLNLKKYIKNKHSKKIINLRNKYRTLSGLMIPIEALDQHEYQYANLGIADIEIAQEKNELFNLFASLNEQNSSLKKMKDKIIINKNKINNHNGIGWTILMKFVADIGLAEKIGFDFNKKKNFEILKFLIKNGADLNAENYMLRDALGFAINYSNFELVKFLVENGAEIKTKSNQNSLVVNNHLDQALELRETKIYNFLKTYKKHKK